jgi:DNA-binding GntR family transcriptional regulator
MKSLSRETFRANLRTWNKRANNEEQISQRLMWERNAIDFASKMAEKYNVSNETVGEVMSALYRSKIIQN